MHIFSNSELCVNTLKLCLKEREDHDEQTTMYPKFFSASNTESYSHDNLIRRILYAVQGRERELGYVFFHYDPDDTADFTREAEK